MKMKKLMSLLLAAVLVLGMLAGCSSSDNPGEGTKAPENPPASQPGGEEQTNPPEDVTITVATLKSAYEVAYPGMWQEVCDAFTAQTGIKTTLICEQNLEDAIGPGMQGGEYPDVVHLATGRDAGLTENFIKDKNIADLTDVLSMTIPGESAKVSDKIIGGFTETTVTNPYADGHTYLAPMFYSPCGLFYNAGLFAAKGWTVPTTWDEMWELGDKAKAENIWLFTYPTTGYFDAFFYALMYSVGGPEFYNNALVYGEGVWDTEAGQKCFDIVAKLAEYTNPVTPAQANDQDFTRNQLLVMKDQALFMPNGTWIVGEMEEALVNLGESAADGFQWGMCALPAATAGGNGASYCWLEQAWIPAQAEHVDAAKQFVAFLYSDAAAAIFAKGGAAQPIEGIVDGMEGDNKMFYSIYDNGADAAMGNFAAYAPVPGLGTNREEFFDPVNGLVSGSVSRDEWAANVKAASDKMRENLVG